MNTDREFVEKVVEDSSQQLVFTTGEFIQKIWIDAWSDPLIATFCGAISVMFVVFVFIEVFYRSTGFSKNASTILPTVGVLGTFVGVYLSVTQFNLNDVQNSLGIIIKGLKSVNTNLKGPF